MDSNFQKALTFVLDHECVFEEGHDGDLNFVVPENVSGDSGGVTKFGIDQASHPHIDIKALTLDQAEQIYHDNEWTKCRCGDLPDGYDIAVFDIAVNNGMGTAVSLLQRSLNEACDIDPPLVVDGFIGIKTLGAARSGGVGGLRRLLLNRQKHYFNIVTLHPVESKFLKGWLNRNNDLAVQVGVNMNAIA